jgi:hypothetical protein
MAFGNLEGLDGIFSALIPRWLEKNYLSLWQKQNPVWQILYEKGKVLDRGWGSVLTEPFRVPSPNAGSGAKRIGSNVTQQMEPVIPAGMTSATFHAPLVAFDYALSIWDLMNLGTETAMADFVQAQLEQNLDSFFADLEQDMWGDPANSLYNGSSDTNLTSLLTMINSGGPNATSAVPYPPFLPEQQAVPIVKTSGSTAQTIVGGLNRADTNGVWWSCPVRYPSTPATLTVQELDRTYRMAVMNNVEPDLIVVHRDLFSVLQNLSTFGGQNGGMLVNDPERARFGHKRLYYLNAEIVHDDNIPTQMYLSGTSTAVNHQIFVLNTKYIQFYMSGKKPEVRPFPNKLMKEFIGVQRLALTMTASGRFHARNCNVAQP